jgi:hypothetical protein
MIAIMFFSKQTLQSKTKNIYILVFLHALLTTYLVVDLASTESSSLYWINFSRQLIFTNFVSYIYLVCYAYNWNSYVKTWEKEFIKETLKKSVLSKTETFDEEEIDKKNFEEEDEQDFNKLGNFVMSTSSELIERNFEKKAFFAQDYYSSVFLA